MTTLEAIAKAKAANLQEVLGVPIVPSVMLGRQIHLPPLETAFFIPRTKEDADLYLELLFSVARHSMAENRIAQLSHADLRWIEPDPRHPEGFYQLYLATAP